MLPSSHMHHIACCIMLCWCSLDLILSWVASGSKSEYVDSGEYVQEDQEQFQSKDITSKMTVTLIPYLALLCLDSRFLRHMLDANHLIYLPPHIAMKPKHLPLLANVVWLSRLAQLLMNSFASCRCQLSHVIT